MSRKPKEKKAWKRALAKLVHGPDGSTEPTCRVCGCTPEHGCPMDRQAKIVCDIPGAPLLVLRCATDEVSFGIDCRPDLRPVENRMGRVVGMQHVGEELREISLRADVLIGRMRGTRRRGRTTIRAVSRKLMGRG